MIYRDFKDKKLSSLGMGCMRLPGDGYGNPFIEEVETRKMVAYAFEKGINYFDTAWGYHAGRSETVMGKILREYPRESYYIATKFPGYDSTLWNKVEEVFEKQLEKTGLEYFDFYLFHNVCEVDIDAYLNPEYGIFDYLKKQKENGRIKHLGFSAHGDLPVLKRFLEAYGKDMEFCQIQLNWFDWTFQDAKAKMELLREWDIPVWVMEPLRGGKFTELTDEDMKELKALRPDANIIEWSFRYLQRFDNVKMILSGMSDFSQAEENIGIFETEKPLNEKESEALLRLADTMIKRNALPCTGCNYCTNHCPMELNIPRFITQYNEICYKGPSFLVSLEMNSLPEEKRPQACLGCRACEEVCPQQIKIADMMTDFSSRLN